MSCVPSAGLPRAEKALNTTVESPALSCRMALTRMESPMATLPALVGLVNAAVGCCASVSEKLVTDSGARARMPDLSAPKACST